jgi:hypothetical protein
VAFASSQWALQPCSERQHDSPCCSCPSRHQSSMLAPGACPALKFCTPAAATTQAGWHLPAAVHVFIGLQLRQLQAACACVLTSLRLLLPCSPNRLMTPGRSPLSTWEDELRVPCNVSHLQTSSSSNSSCDSLSGTLLLVTRLSDVILYSSQQQPTAAKFLQLHLSSPQTTSTVLL